MPEPTEQTDTIDMNENTRSIERDVKRLKQMLEQLGSSMTANVVMAEIASTVLPYLRDLTLAMSNVEDNLAWCADKVEEHDDMLAGGPGREESQLLPEDAEKFRAFLGAVKETCSKSLEHMDKGSPEAHGLSVLEAGADELLQLVTDIELEPIPEEPPPDQQAN